MQWEPWGRSAGRGRSSAIPICLHHQLGFATVFLFLLLLPEGQVMDGNIINKNNAYCARLRNGLCSFKNYE